LEETEGSSSGKTSGSGKDSTSGCKHENPITDGCTEENNQLEDERSLEEKESGSGKEDQTKDGKGSG
jgi:hypothetical protein